MAWTTPRDWSTGEVVTAAMLDTDIKDNLSYLYNGRETCVLDLASAQSIPNSSITTILFTSETTDTDTMHSNVTNTGRITFTTAGVYVVTALAVWSNASATGLRHVYIDSPTFGIVGGATVPGQTVIVPLAGASAIVVAAATNYVEMKVQQNSGGALDLNAGSRFCAARIG